MCLIFIFVEGLKFERRISMKIIVRHGSGIAVGLALLKHVVM